MNSIRSVTDIQIHLADQFWLPVDVMTRTVGILAQKGSGKCLSEETEIIDPFTGVPHTIREVVEQNLSTHVLTLDANKNLDCLPITQKVNTGLNDCLQVKLSSGRSIVATREHPFLTPSGWQHAEELGIGSSVAIPARIPFPEHPLALLDAEVILLAVLLAEGGYTQRGVRFSTTDETLLDLVKQAAAEMNLVVKHHASQKDWDYNLLRKDQAGPSAREMLRRYGMEGLKARDKTIPSIIYRLPPHQLARFLSLFWMCDGYVDKSGPGLTLASEKMVRQLQHLLLRFGIQSRVSAKKAFSNGKSFSAFRLTVYARSYQAFCQHIPLWGEKKERLIALCARSRNANVGFPQVSPAFISQIQLLAQTRSGRWKGGALKQVAQKIGWKTPYFWTSSLFVKGRSLSLDKFQAFCEVYECTDTYQWLWDSDIFWDSIVEINPVGLRRTYDLTVEPTACFVANDIVVHNTYTALKMMEQMVKAGLPVIYIDPLGVAWGIRSSADGQGPGLPVLIFGGRHGDRPLPPTAGKAVAELILRLRQPMVLDMVDFPDTDAQRLFVAELLEYLHLHNQLPLHLILDEADIFAPQQLFGKVVQRSFAAVDTLVRRDRVIGLGGTLITQRPAVLHTNIREQIEALFVLRIVGKHSRKAVRETIEQQATEEQVEQFLATLATQPNGTAWIWSPEWLKIFRQIRISQRETFDSSITPAVGVETLIPQQLAPVDLPALDAQLEQVIGEVEASDPVRLRTRIAKLEEELRHARGAQTQSGGAAPGSLLLRSSAGQEEQDGLRQQLDALQAQLTAQHEQFTLHLRELEEENEELRAELEQARAALASYEQQGTSGEQERLSARTLQTPGLHAAHVHFEQAQISHFYAGDTDVGNGKGSPADAGRDGGALPIEVEQGAKAPAMAAPEALPLEQLRWSEKQLLDRLIRQVKQLSPSEKLFFVWLLEHDEKPVPSRDLADAVCIDRDATRRSRTDLLVNFPFIHRTGKQRFLFQATIGAYCRKHFRSVADHQVLVQQLVLAASRV